MTELPAPESDREQLARAIGSLIWKDPERILDAVSRSRGSDIVIECRLRGGSMEPAIARGSRLRIDAGQAPPYPVGAVVAFVRESDICVHRIAYVGRGRKSSGSIITQGDACLNPDPPMDVSRVIGTVSWMRQGECWSEVAAQAAPGRAQSFLGRSFLKLISTLMEIDMRLARTAAKALRVRKENAVAVET